jgi:hypothetical protein
VEANVVDYCLVTDVFVFLGNVLVVVQVAYLVLWFQGQTMGRVQEL